MKVDEEDPEMMMTNVSKDLKKNGKDIHKENQPTKGITLLGLNLEG